jgi:hypothetical protein
VKSTPWKSIRNADERVVYVDLDEAHARDFFERAAT